MVRTKFINKGTKRETIMDGLEACLKESIDDPDKCQILYHIKCYTELLRSEVIKKRV